MGQIFGRRLETHNGGGGCNVRSLRVNQGCEYFPNEIQELRGLRLLANVDVGGRRRRGQKWNVESNRTLETSTYFYVTSK